MSNETGTVKWFDVHMSGIQMEGFKTLKEDQTVSYETGTSDKGPMATNVIPG